MSILDYTIIAFVVLESLNVLILYFFTDSTKGNGVAIFNAYHESKANKDLYQFVLYIVYWVAGTKLIFIALLIVILLFGNDVLKLYSIGALSITIATFYWKLYPIIKNLDNENRITPKGYSKTLFFTILAFIGMLLLAAGIYLL